MGKALHHLATYAQQRTFRGAESARFRRFAHFVKEAREACRKDFSEVDFSLGELDERAAGGSEAVREIKRRRVAILRKRLERFAKAQESREVIARHTRNGELVVPFSTNIATARV